MKLTLPLPSYLDSADSYSNSEVSTAFIKKLKQSLCFLKSNKARSIFQCGVSATDLNAHLIKERRGLFVAQNSELH